MSKIPTKMQHSAGGVPFRNRKTGIQVAIIRASGDSRWQLPKGLVHKGESPEAAALREVREETGLETATVGPIDRVEYWYYSKNRQGRVRFHKFVDFYLLRYLSGDVRNHDSEVEEARWVGIDKAIELLEFGNEKNIVRRARAMLEAA